MHPSSWPEGGQPIDCVSILGRRRWCLGRAVRGVGIAHDAQPSGGLDGQLLRAGPFLLSEQRCHRRGHGPVRPSCLSAPVSETTIAMPDFWNGSEKDATSPVGGSRPVPKRPLFMALMTGTGFASAAHGRNGSGSLFSPAGCAVIPRGIHSFPTRRSSDLDRKSVV